MLRFRNQYFALLLALVSITGMHFSYSDDSTPAGAGQDETSQQKAPDHPPSVKPEVAQKQFTVPEDLKIELAVAEPEVSQPLSISFDERGRMWVLQYLQYPIPNGLKPVQVDQYLRTKYDKVPEPPPHGATGKDRISIYEDREGNGRWELVSHFLSNLNLGSGMALGDDGVYVLQSPYLLFYPDRNKDDVPDSNPEVLLKGFGMEDAHAYANSLTWGPDGWLYGDQGSTVTANIRGIEFQQGVWRYHPPTKRFELFSEGGGNSWGIDFDRMGNIFAAGNTVEPMVHHLQGAYYVKGFGKHGPLHNPYTYGYFMPVKHHGYVGDSLTGGFVIYQGGAFPERFNNSCIAPNTRHSASRWSTIENRGSTFASRAAGDFITTSDIWFRPVESTIGPDGALYVADWYDYNISHSSPVNRAHWYMPSRFDGRIWRVSAKEETNETRPFVSGSFNLEEMTSKELVDVMLHHRNAWWTREAHRILKERKDSSVYDQLAGIATTSGNQEEALKGLWALYSSGGMTEELYEELLKSPHEYVRSWVIRLLGDENSLPENLFPVILEMAKNDPSVIVRSQLACTAKRIPGEQCLPIVSELWKHDEDEQDPFMPLLIWWALEDKAISHTSLALELFNTDSTWNHSIVKNWIIDRLTRRLTEEATPQSFEAVSRFIKMAPSEKDRAIIAGGLATAWSGKKLDSVPSQLRPGWEILSSADENDSTILELGMRLNDPSTFRKVLSLISDSSQSEENRVRLIKTMGEVRQADQLLTLVDSAEGPILKAVLEAVGFTDHPETATRILENHSRFDSSTKALAIQILSGRAAWGVELLKEVEKNRIPKELIPYETLQQLSEHHNEQIDGLIAKQFGKIGPATPHEKQGRIKAILGILRKGTGTAEAGKPLFVKHCGICHKLHGEGNSIGPDLTGAERKDVGRLTSNIIDPSSMIRQQYIAQVIQTDSGRVLTGLLAEATPETITILDSKNKRTVLNRDEIEEMKESTISLMPEKILEPLSNQEIRDLYAYLMSDQK